jgi:hypothetical protein
MKTKAIVAALAFCACTTLGMAAGPAQKSGCCKTKTECCKKSETSKKADCCKATKTPTKK